jgi:hypothetical protein
MWVSKSKSFTDEDSDFRMFSVRKFSGTDLVIVVGSCRYIGQTKYHEISSSKKKGKEKIREKKVYIGNQKSVRK